MLTFTDSARAAVRGFLEENPDEPQALRITLHDGSPLAPSYDLTLVNPADRDDEEIEFDTGEFSVLVHADSTERLDGATVDFVEQDEFAGFQIRDLAGEAAFGDATGPLAERVRGILDAQVNPGIASHGGAINLVGVKGSDVYIQMSGGCQGCALSRMTLRQGVERMLRQSIPEIGELHDVTDHAGGENPYFER